MNIKTLQEYQKAASKFAKYKTIDYPFLALSEEVGEVNGKLAKYVRKHGVPADIAISDAEISFGGKGEKLRLDLTKELGDVLWQLTNCAKEIGVSLEEVANTNIEKLTSRDERNQIIGEGDER